MRVAVQCGTSEGSDELEPSRVDLAGPGPRPAFPLQHHPRAHGARWTRNYVFNQLIPYLGNKRKLLPLIAQAVARTGITSGTFLDVFSGSGVVARLAKTLGYCVIANDWEPYSFEINEACIKHDQAPSFRGLGGMQQAFDDLNALKGVDGYIAIHYCPRNDIAPDTATERMFFSHANGARIDAIRQGIEDWYEGGAISRAEKSVLLAALIYSASYVSNTSGVFKGFHNGWGGRNGTALYRILSDIRLEPPVFFGSGVEGHEVYREDARDLVRRLDSAVDIAYVDPPYNQHQYGANYHLLNTIALWDKPPLERSIRVGGREFNKSAIRIDWRILRRSRYCYRSSATAELEDLVANLEAKWVLVSYGLEGIIPVRDLVRVLCQHGRVDCMWQSYKRYRVSPTRPSPEARTVETVFILRKGPEAKGNFRAIYEKLQEAMQGDVDGTTLLV